MKVEFRLLGDFEVRVHGKPVDAGHPRQQSVLVALAVEVNRSVSVDQLLFRVWGDALPHRGRETLYSYISRLRRVLAPAADVSITRQAGGYLLCADEMSVDLFQFRRCVTSAKTCDDQARLTLLDQALALWRDEALTSLDTAWTDSLRRTLQRERLAAEADRTDVALRLGLHNEELAALPARAAQHPLDERIAGQYMLALFRAGRPADALRHYRQLRARLADEVGMDPGDQVRELHQAILANDPKLTISTVHFGGSPVPRQLPAPPWSFTGRLMELAGLEKVPAGHLATISGAGGVGKTWLALRWAHQAADRFPDGQLYADLHGFDPAADPVSPGVVVRGFLEALGTDPESIPADPDAQFGLYRSLVAGRRMLIVLDNARDSGQVLPLIPGSGASSVLVTSRHQLTALAASHGTHTVALDVFTLTEARDMMVHRLGHERVNREPAAVAELLDHCACLPLALSVIAARAAAHPDLPLATFAEELRDTATRLDALDMDELSTTLRAALSCSYDALPAEEANALGLVGLAPGPDLGLRAAASLIGRPESQTRIILRRLSEMHLVQQHIPRRYRLHDLVRLYLAERVENGVPALRRLVAFYADTAYAGERLLNPQREPIAPHQPLPGCQQDPIPNRTAALVWFDTEHRCLLAAQDLAVRHGWHAYVWQLAWSLTTFHWRRGHQAEDLLTQEAGLAAADQLGEPAARAVAHRLVGDVYLRMGEYTAVHQHYNQALALFEDTGNLLAQSHVHTAIAVSHSHQGDDRKALVHSQRALEHAVTLNEPIWHSDKLNTVGWFHAKLGDYEQARSHCEHALVLARHHGYRENEAATLDSLGYIAHATGDLHAALVHYRHALALRRDLGDQYDEADVYAHLGEIHATLGDTEQAQDAWTQAIALYTAQHRTTQAQSTQDLLYRL